MKSRVIVIALVCVAGASSFLTSVGVNTGNVRAGTATDALPATLDQFYPPAKPAPAYQLAMLDLGRLLSGTMCDVLENDFENAIVNFEAFKKAYAENSAMITEWKDRFPMTPVEQMEAAIATGDPSKIMPAAEAMGAVCHQCHLAFMPAVQQKYHWGRFSDIVLTDPLSKSEVSYAQLMLMMETNFDGIANDLAQGQYADALQQFAGFRARFQVMGEACVTCHNSDRLYYVSSDITERISDLQVELYKSKIDVDVVRGILLTIGQESCSKCHLVHIPAAYGQQSKSLR